MDLRKLKTLIDLVQASGIAEIEINEEGDHQVAFLLCMVRCSGRSQRGYQSTMAAIQPKITSGML